MGCSGSKDVEIIKPDNAEDAYKAAADPKLAGQFASTSNLYGLTEGSREELLEELFEYVDDDKSGTVELKEYAQLFDKRVDESLKAKFGEIDGEIDSDGTITKDEFIKYHLKKFEKLNDTLFAEILNRLLLKAQNATIDEAGEVVPETAASPNAGKEGLADYEAMKASGELAEVVEANRLAEEAAAEQAQEEAKETQAEEEIGAAMAVTG